MNSESAAEDASIQSDLTEQQEVSTVVLARSAKTLRRFHAVNAWLDRLRRIAKDLRLQVRRDRLNKPLDKP